MRPTPPAHCPAQLRFKDSNCITTTYCTDIVGNQVANWRVYGTATIRDILRISLNRPQARSAGSHCKYASPPIKNIEGIIYKYDHVSIGRPAGLDGIIVGKVGHLHQLAAIGFHRINLVIVAAVRPGAEDDFALQRYVGVVRQ